MRQGKVTVILAVQINCPYCGGICDELERGSSMILEEHKVVECEDCNERCEVPANAFMVRTAKAKKVTAWKNG